MSSEGVTLISRAALAIRQTDSLGRVHRHG
jgi:hypothetical protein